MNTEVNLDTSMYEDCKQCGVPVADGMDYKGLHLFYCSRACIALHNQRQETVL